MSNLVPEIRKDKTGKMVTRWVKKDNAKSSAGLGIPKVSDAQNGIKVIRKKTITRAAKLLSIHSYYETVLEARTYVSEFLDKFQDARTFEVINTALDRDPKRIIEIEIVVADYPEHTARERIHFMEYINDDFSIAGNDYDALFAGLKSYDIFAGVEDLTMLTGTDHESAVALIRVGMLAKNHGDSQYDPDMRFRWHMQDEVLVSAVLNNLDRTDEIIEFMSSRSVFDGKAVNDYLNEHTALHDGYL